MGNLGIQCDMQSCYMCDTCIYDEELKDNNDMADVKTVATKRYYCNGCEFLNKLKVSSYSTTYNNLYCKNCENGTQKLIDISVPDTRMITVPKWCAINKGIKPEVNETKALPSTIHVHKSWYSFEPQIKFEDIKVGDVLHIPPYDNHKRQDIIITAKSEFSATYRTLSQNSASYSVSTLWPNTLQMRMITRHKIQNIEVKEQKS